METPVEFSRIESQLETILMSHSAVRDCAVLTRTTTSGQFERVAYVVPSGPFQPERLREHILAASAPLTPDHFVPLYSIPRDADGRADVKALETIEVIDPELIDKWEDKIRASGVKEVAVVARPAQDRLPALHLSDLLADWKPAIADGIADSKTSASFRQPLPAHREYTPMALADGGPLHISANAPRTLTHALIRSAETCNGKGVTYIQADGTEISQSYAQLLEDAKCVLSGLQENGLKPHDRVILQLESLKDHFTTFWACVLGGITPVTVAVAPSYSEANGVVNKLFNTWKLLEKPVIIASDNLVEPISGVAKFLPMSGMRTLRSSQLKKTTPSSDIYESKPEDLVFFQLTSGSTGIPKCIQETHRGIISHIHGAQLFNDYRPDDVDLNWLPVDHVVPILTCHLKNVYLGCRQVQIKTELVLTKPLKWLDYLESQKATHTWSPNFGFKLVSDALAKAPEKKWDLSRMKFFMNAGEQVTLPVVRNFLQGLAPFGVPPEAMQPSFGMAECCTCMTYQNTFDVENGVHRVAKSSLGGPLKRAESEADGISFVDLGPPVPGVAIRITNSENRLVEEGVIGRFQIKGDVVTPGYLNNDAANREAFVGDGWFNSGDLGFILNGRLTLTGREKEMIIIRGANFYCYEIEDVVNRIDGAEPTFTAACAVADPSTGTEGLAVFFVPRSPDSNGLADHVRTVRARVTAEMGIAPAFVIPLARKDFPKTTSGKIQRSALKKALESGGFKDVLKDLDIRLETSNTLPDWFFKRTWQRQLPGPEKSPSAPQSFLLFGDESGLAIRTATLLRKDGHSCVLVEAASAFTQSAPQHFRLDPKNASHYRELLESLAAQHSLPDRVLHFWTYSPFSEASGVEEFTTAQDRGTYSVLFLAQALAHSLGPKRPARLLIVSNHTQSVLPSDLISCDKSPLLGLVRTLPQEMPWLECAHIDISGEEESAEAMRVLCETNLVRLEPEVAWRSGLRFVPRLERASLARSNKKPLPFKKGGRYLITGGLGGIGAEVARHLLSTYAANVLLVGRTPLPERGTWDLHRGKNEPLSTRIQSFSELEKLPGRVDYKSVEISNPDALRSAVADVEMRWGGTLDGVIHLAGVFEEKLLVEETRDSFEKVMNPKALGALALSEVLNERPDSFIILFSSVNSLFGGATVGAYAAANSFLDGFAAARSKRHPATTYCLAWSPWDETGMSRGYALKAVSRARGYYFISPRQGIDSLLAALHSEEPQLIAGLDGANENIRQRAVSPEVHARQLIACIAANSKLTPHALPRLDDRFGVSSHCRFETLDVLPKTADGEIDRTRLERASRTRGESSDPSTETERRIAAIWREALGINHVGIADNFFELGGHSLLAAQILFRLQEEFKVELSLRDLFDAPTIQSLATRIDGAEKSKDAGSWPQIAPNHEREFESFKLTEIQQAYWLGRTSVFELGNVGCHIYTEVEFADLDLPRFNIALQQLIQRHPMLRSVIRPDGTQCVLKEVPPYIVRVNDLRGVNADDAAAQLKSVRASMSHQVLDTSRAPLFEIRASKMDDRLRLHISIDLLIADARSFQILIDDMSRLYEKPEQPLPALDLTFRDYVEAAGQLESREEFKRAREYWLKRLNTLPPAPDLPLAANSEALRTPRFVRRQVRLAPARWQKLKERAARAGITPAGILMGIYAEILGIWSKRPRFSLNLTLFNRLPLHPQVNEVVGDFTSVTLLEVERDAKKCFEERCRRMQEQLWDDLNHRFFSGVQVMREMARSQSGMPAAAMPVVFTSILDLPSAREHAPSLLKHANFVYGISQTPQVWLDNQVYQDGETLVCNWDAVEGLFPAGMLDDMFSAYEGMLQELSADGALWSASHSEVIQKSIPVSQIASRTKVNDTAAPVSSKLLHTLFTERAAATPVQPAIICGSRSISYAELDARSNQIAWQLRQAGAKPNTLIAIVCEKGCEQIIAALSILKSGAAYLPIDSEVPNERLQYLLKHSEARFALTTGKVAERLNWPDGVARIRVDEPAAIDGNSGPLEPVQTPQDLAYVIYTSGSTGNPKGVVIDHRGAVNTILDINSRFGIGREDKVFGISQLTFDLSVYDIFGTFAAGGTLVLPEAGRTRDPLHWAELIEQHSVTVWNSVPALVNVLIENAGERRDLSSLRVIMMSGDWIPVALPDRIRLSAPNARLISLGGATEASIWSILYPIEKVDPAWKSIPYGKPMLNQSFQVLNEKLSPCPDWVPGNLYIGGIGLAKGYWRDDEKTRTSFITHPATGERLYRTGDLGRYLPDGNIEFLGREDFQVKVNGFRIELGEIETVLEKHPSVRTAVVIAAGSGDNRRLVAYIVPQTHYTADAETLRSYLKQKLPEYMVPLSYVALESLPLTSNGKVDRRALPDAETPKVMRKSEYQAPRNALEEVLAGIAAEILNLERVGIFDNFFELGGNSLLVIQVASRIRDVLDVEIAANALFDSSTVASLAAQMLRDPEQREKIERSAEVLLSVADVPESDVDAWLSQSSYI